MARFRGQLSALDVELLALILRREMKVYDLGEDDHPEPENPDFAYFTPDRRFLLEFAGPEEFTAMRQLVEDLYSRDEGGAGRLIEATRWEQHIELEESARRWRNGRLRDLGVPDFEEAISFYARPAARKQEPPAPGAATQALLAPEKNLIEAALEKLTGEDLELAEEALIYAANAALVANRVPLDDPDEVRAQLAEARATLALGLELLSGGEVDGAAAILAEEPIRGVFQAAMGEAYRLQTRARKIAQAARLPQAQSATLLDEPLESAVQALLKPRPLFHEPGQRRPRAFGSRADVAAAERLLDEAEEEVALLAALGIPPSLLGPRAEEAGLGPAALKASGAVRALVESQLRGEPFALRDTGDAPLPQGFSQKLDELKGGLDDPARRALDRIRSVLFSAQRGRAAT
jgi:hypothetical protein